MTRVLTLLNHQEVLALFGPLIDGELSAEQEGDLRRHLGACEGCRAALARYERGVELVRGMRGARAPRGFAERTLARMRLRRAHGAKAGFANQVQTLLPIETLIPMLLSIIVAVMLLFASL